MNDYQRLTVLREVIDGLVDAVQALADQVNEASSVRAELGEVRHKLWNLDVGGDEPCN